MRLLRFCSMIFMGMLMLSYIPTSKATIITLNPSSQDVLLGEKATVDVVLEQPDGNFVGAFDFFINFDASILALSNVIQRTSLGGPFDSFFDSVAGVGRVNVSEVSLLFDLSAVQDAVSDFSLFTLDFDTLSVGSSDLIPEENILGFAGGFVGDDLGFGISLNAIVNGAINVVDPSIQPPTGVSEPSLLLFLLLFIPSLIFLRRM